MLKRDDKKKRPDAVAPATEAPQTSWTVNLDGDTSSYGTRPTNGDKPKRRTRPKKPQTPKPETFLADVPVPRGIARISVVEEKKGPLIHARRWFYPKGEVTLAGSREGFTIASPEHARVLAQGLLEAADMMENHSAS